MNEEIDAIKAQIAELAQREDSDTVYDDTEIRGLLAELQATQSEISDVIFITETEYNDMVTNGTLGDDTYIVYRPTV